MTKDCRDHIAKPLYYIVNLSLATGIVPTAWKRAKIKPVFKSDDVNKVENFRPISILPVLSKLLEKSVHSQFIEYLESEKLQPN